MSMSRILPGVESRFSRRLSSRECFLFRCDRLHSSRPGPPRCIPSLGVLRGTGIVCSAQRNEDRPRLILGDTNHDHQTRPPGAGRAAALLPAAALIRSAQAQSANETTFDRIRRTKTLRIAALPGELPYFQKDLTSGEWSGACIDMAKDIAKVFDAQLAYVESTYGNSVLDLQSNKVDLAFALNPTPQRALSIGFTHPMIIHPFGCVARKGLDPNTWDDINKPEIRVVYRHRLAA